jgi:4-amino-4-deoxy-L-arabinose transferase-like glycosyltransferase
MTKEVSRDEQMYSTAGVLLGQGQMIYRDFSYPSQLPYHPLLLAALYRGLGTTRYLLVGRLVSVVCDILVVVFILLIYRSLFGPRRMAGSLFGLAATLLYAFNPLVDYAAGYAWNHDVVILCVVASLWLLLTTDFEKRSSLWRPALMGGLLTLATFMRVTTVLVEGLFLAAVLFLAGGPVRQRLRTALPFCIAALVVMIWPLWVIAQAPQAFWLNLVPIPALYGRWLHEIGRVFSKPALTVAALSTPGYLVLLVLAGGLAWACRHAWRGPLASLPRGDRILPMLSEGEQRKALVTILLPLVFFVIAYIPPTMWQQYLAMPVPFLVVSLAYPLLALSRRADRRAGTGLPLSGQMPGRPMPDTDTLWPRGTFILWAGALVAVIAYPVALYRIPFLATPQRWTPIELHSTGVAIAADLKEPGPVLTLGPLYALEGGRDIYPALSCGSIVYRVADRLSARQRQITHTVGPATLRELTLAHRPAGVIVGVEPSYFAFLEEPLRELVSSDWRRDSYGGRLQVYRRP